MNHSTEDTGRTPGQAAQEASAAILRDRYGNSVLPWKLASADTRDGWETIAQAAIAQAAAVNTDEDPQAELAAVHELLAAIVAAAGVPLPASEGNADDMTAYYQACTRRLNYIHAMARVFPGGSALFIRGAAQAITENAARPLPYKAEGEQP